MGPFSRSIKKSQKSLPRALTPAHTAPVACPPGRRRAASLISTASLTPGRKACIHELGLTGQNTRKPSRGTCPPLQLGNPGPCRKRSKVSHVPLATGCDCRVLASGDCGSPVEGWALQTSSVLLQTEEELLPPHQPLPETGQIPALGSDPFWKVHCVPGLSLHLHLILTALFHLQITGMGWGEVP